MRLSAFRKQLRQIFAILPLICNEKLIIKDLNQSERTHPLG